MAQELTSKKLGTMPIGKLIFSMSGPAILSMLVQALYNIVDSIFVAQISEAQLELTAVSVAFPIQNLMIAVAVNIKNSACGISASATFIFG